MAHPTAVAPSTAPSETAGVPPDCIDRSRDWRAGVWVVRPDGGGGPDRGGGHAGL